MRSSVSGSRAQEGTAISDECCKAWWMMMATMRMRMRTRMMIMIDPRSGSAITLWQTSTAVVANTEKNSCLVEVVMVEVPAVF